jgi:hypothetical protein
MVTCRGVVLILSTARALAIGFSAIATTAACGTGSAGTSPSTPPPGWDGAVDALAQEVILSTSGPHEILLDSSAAGMHAEAPPQAPTGYMSGTGVGFLTCNYGSDCSDAHVEISEFRVWLQGSTGWALAQSGRVEGSVVPETLEGSGVDAGAVQGAGTVQLVQIPNDHTYLFYANQRFQPKEDFNGNFVVAITARVVGGSATTRYGLMAGINFFSALAGGVPVVGGLGRYIVLSSEPTTVGYTNVAPEALLSDPPAQQ